MPIELARATPPLALSRPLGAFPFAGLSLARACSLARTHAPSLAAGAGRQLTWRSPPGLPSLPRALALARSWYWASAEHDPPVERHAAAWRAFPELATLDRLHFFPGLLVASSIYSYGGAEAALWGFVVPVVGCWNGIFSIGSLCHGRSAGGTRPFETGGCDQSTNVWWVAWLTLGDGWHNNHHAFRWSARHGLRWYEVDVTYALLRGLEACGVVWDLKVPSEEQIARAEQRSASGARLASRAADSQSES